MSFIEFRNCFIEVGCVATNQIVSQYPDFNTNNLTRWVRQGLLVKLRQGFYAFPEMKGQSDFSLYISNRIYKPSYVSLHTVLAFYGIIPEAITQITGVSSLKTAQFENSFGTYSYKTMKENLIFGYELKPFGNRTILFAHPEKALLDLLYLYPFYNTEEDMEELRLDEDFMTNEINIKRLDEYTERFNNKALANRVRKMKKTYVI